MKNKNERKYQILSKNHHLMNILERDYYIEIGVISLKKINRFINGEELYLSDIIDLNILSEGIGAITGNNICDVYYQLNYLINLRLKNSTCKFLLTLSTLKYLDEEGCEKYAPIFFIPFDFDYQTMTIKASNNVLINKDLLNKIASISKDVKEHFVEEYSNKKIYDASDIDRIGLELAKISKSPIEPTNYLTIAYIEYPDFDIAVDYMTPQRSLYELSEEAIMKRYFKDILAVLPTNINQKHIILKANDGENFSVDGRLGSGKTHTIINIIADQISKGKKILYVNQDSDNIFDIEKNIYYLGFDNYAYNLTKNIRDLSYPEVTLEEEFTYDANDLEIDKLISFQTDIQKRIHGYKIQTILERLAILKHEYPYLEKIKIENKLEYHEINKVYKDLLEIENSLTKIDLYASNIWHRLHISHNNISKEDIIARVKSFEEIHNLLYSEVKLFSKKYSLEEINSINDLYKHILHIYSFASVRPLTQWQNESKRKEVKQDLYEIQSFVDTNYSLNKYYEKHIDNSYKVGRIEEIFKLITDGTIEVDSKYNSDDAIYFNRLIAYNDDLSNLANMIGDHLKYIYKAINSLKQTFEIKDLTEDASNSFIKLSNFLNNFKWNRKYIDLYLSSPAIFTKSGTEIVELYNSYVDSKELITRYVNRFDQLTMKLIGETILKKNKNRIFASFINTKNAKKDNVEVDFIVENIHKYYESMEKIQLRLATMLGKVDYDENAISQFVLFVNYIDSLTPKEAYYFKVFLEQLSVQRSHETYIKTTKALLDTYNYEVNKINEICEELKNYNIIIADTSIAHKLELLELWKFYLLEVHKLKDEIKVIFKNNSVTYNEVVELIKNDKIHKELLIELEKNSERYKKHLGKYYKGLDTIINEVGQTIEHYGEFLKHVKDFSFIDEIINKKFDQLLEDTKKIDQLFSKWTNRYRLFSICFRGGQPELTSNSFEKNTRLLKQFLDKTNQITDILHINELTEEFLEFGLKDLYEGIRSCRYNRNIASRFIYTIYDDYYHEALVEYPILKHFDETINMIDDYINYEYNYCKNNIQLLKASSLNVKKMYLSDLSYEFNQYNKIVNALIKNTNLFYANLDIFNSNLNLELFDLVLIDDAHLSSANKYNRLSECKQVIVFGSSVFQTSVSNALMTRLGEGCRYQLNKSYIKMLPTLSNEWNNNHQFIFTFDNKSKIIMKDSFNDFIIDIFEKFKKEPKHIYNILVYKEETRRNIYTAMVKELVDLYTPEEIMNLFFYNIRIINASSEGNRYVNDVFIYYDDFVDLEDSLKELVFKNFLTAHNNVLIYFIKNKSETVNKRIKASINEVTKKELTDIENYSGIVEVIKNKLSSCGIKVRSGFGGYDLIIPNDKPVAIRIVGKENDYLFNFIDEYMYYYKEYQKHNWSVMYIYIIDLIIDAEKVINRIIEVSSSGVPHEE